MNPDEVGLSLSDTSTMSVISVSHQKVPGTNLRQVSGPGVEDTKKYCSFHSLPKEGFIVYSTVTSAK